HLIHLALIGEITHEVGDAAVTVAGDVVCSTLQFVGVAGADGDAGPGGGELAGQDKPQAAGAARDEDSPPPEAEASACGRGKGEGARAKADCEGEMTAMGSAHGPSVRASSDRRVSAKQRKGGGQRLWAERPKRSLRESHFA